MTPLEKMAPFYWVDDQANGADIDKVDGNKWCALNIAIANDQEEIALYIIEQGSSLNRWDASDCSPLHFSVVNHIDTITNCLIQHGACLDFCDITVWSPMTSAIEKDYIDTTTILIE